VSSQASASTTLGIIAGRGALPLRLVEHCRGTGRPVFVLAVEGETDPSLVSEVPHAWVRLGAAATIFGHLRDAGVRDLVLAGAMKRPSFANIRPDWRAAKIIARIGMKALGDDGLLQALIKEFEAEGFTIIGADKILGGLVARDGVLGRHAPDAQALADVAHGFAVVKALGALDIGQAAVVQQGLVLGVEAIEGTDALLERCGTLRREGPGGVLVKARKPVQDNRVDLPSIGPLTVEHVAAAGLRGIAVEAGASLIIECDAVVAAADRLGLFVIGHTPPNAT